MIGRFLLVVFISASSLEAMSGQYRQAVQRWYQSMAQNLRRVSAVVWQRAYPAKASPLPVSQSERIAATAMQRAKVSAKSQNLPQELRSRSLVGTPVAGSAVDIASFLLDYNRKSQEELKKEIKQKEIENLGPSETRHNLTTRLKKTISGIHTQKEPGFKNAIDELPIAVQKQLLKAFTKEEQLLQDGYICFYHAQGSSTGSCNDIVNTVFFKLLDELQPDDFRFIQFRYYGFRAPIEKIAKYHTELLSQGEHGSQLAVNLFIFANTGFGGWSGSSTLDRVLHNTPSVFIKPQWFIVDFLRSLGVYGESGKELDLVDKNRSLVDLTEQVLALDNQVYKNGRLLLVAVPEKEVDKNVFTVIYLKNRDYRIPLNFSGKELHQFSDVLGEIKKDAQNVPFEIT